MIFFIAIFYFFMSQLKKIIDIKYYLILFLSLHELRTHVRLCN
jgi:hypothetical protein